MRETMTDYRALLRKNLAGIAPYRTIDPVEAVAAQHGVQPERIVRLNLNENPYGTPLRVQEALATYERYHHYPDPESRDIRRLLAEYTGTDARRIIVGNGSDEIIDLLLALFVEPGEAVLIPTPTFGMYATRAHISGARIAAVPRHDDFLLDIEAMEAALTPDVKLVFVASPNNPSGNLARERDIVRLLEHGVIVMRRRGVFRV